MPDPTVRPTPDEEWEDLMHQLRQRPQALPRPFFYPRVRARLAAGPAAERPALPGWLRRPAYAVLCGAVVLVLSGDGAAERPAAGAPRGASGLSGSPTRPLPR
ncbi:hypothetical protein [Hymenobacter nivis]|uniref:Uncharacterized protein n=1 Tax=Hymenobacter nivis TaxID=1850093 RepID=A0A2Z3GQW4_9BACT|nr:hypothetical protein [Hymenobacter nivis]AWM34851.1 hypothetical protein DDQ68_19955 [Hymenobacter nivis]